MLIISNHQENSNQNYVDILSYPSKMPVIRKTSNAGQDESGKELLTLTDGRNGSQHGGSLEHWKLKYHTVQL